MRTTTTEDGSLNRSVYRTRGGKQFKSCPRCSVKKGKLVFHPLEEYGERKMENGDIVPQSWCRGCRNKGGRNAKN
jgi:hypothetical protein